MFFLDSTFSHLFSFLINSFHSYNLCKIIDIAFVFLLVIGKLVHADLDERALDALKEFPANDALNVLSQFLESNLEHVSNKSAYLCGIMKTYRQQKGRGGSGVSAANSIGSTTKGPDDEKIKVSFFHYIFVFYWRCSSNEILVRAVLF